MKHFSLPSLPSITPTIALLCLVILAAEAHAAGRSPSIDSAVENAVVAGNWPAVAAAYATEAHTDAAAVQRALAGHAFLMLNRNNDALRTFLSLRQEGDLEEWVSWTRQLVRAHDAAIPYYLQGDALARRGDLDAAIRAYDEALRRDSALAPALVARGVARAARREWEAARQDFKAALAAHPGLTEAYTGFGNLLLARQAPEGAKQYFDRALLLSPDYALALNGRGCAHYGLGKWEDAHQDFIQAASTVPLPLFLGNVRALAVAAENLQFPDLDNSPLFRFTDFLDWPSLQAETQREGDPLRLLLGHALPAVLDSDMLDELNRALERRDFYTRVETQFDLTQAPPALLTAIQDTASVRRDNTRELTEQEVMGVRSLNRLVLEHAYPMLIARHAERNPGVQLKLANKMWPTFVDQLAYKRGLAPEKLARGYRNIELGQALTDALRTLPFTGGLTSRFDRHLSKSKQTTAQAYKEKTGRDIDPGGVSSDLRRAYVDKANWPVANWFGLVQWTEVDRIIR